MIVQFWIGAALLLIIAGLVFVAPFLIESKKFTENGNAAKRNRLNRDLYDVRLRELEQEELQGLILDKQTIITELQHNLLDDISEQQPLKQSKKNRWLWLPGLLILILGSLSLYWASASYQQLHHWQNVLQRYPALQNKLFADPAVRPSEQDLRDIMLGLRTHLVKYGDDPQGWLLYSRLAMLFKDSEQAINAVNKAYQLDPQSSAVRLAYIQLKMQGDSDALRQAEMMLMDLLAEQPDQLDAWSMYAFIALQKKDYAAAVQRWQKMLPLVDENSEQAKILHDSIAYAKQQIPSSEGKRAASENSVSVESTKEQTGGTLEQAVYQVEVSIAAHVTVPENAYLFVYATPADTAMPIAALKIPVSRFPVRVQLSDANSMMEGNKLSAHSTFIIKARLSSDGSTGSAIWQGKSEEVKSGDGKTIKLLVAQPI